MTNCGSRDLSSRVSCLAVAKTSQGRSRFSTLPKARGGKFEHMAVGVAEVNAFPTTRPIDFRFDVDTMRLKVGFPGLPSEAAIAKATWRGPAPSCAGMQPTRQHRRLQGSASTEEQDHRVAGGIERTEPFVLH